MKKIWQWSVMLSLVAAGAILPASAQNFPDKPIRFIVPYSAGGGTDTTARVIAEGLAKRIGQSVVVENRPGGGSSIGTDYVIKSKADGYTLLYGTGDAVTVLPAINPKLPYKVPEDLIFLTRAFISPYTVAVSNSLPVNTWADFLAHAKANPGKIRYGTSGYGGGGHLATVLLEMHAGISMVHVPYKGIGQLMPDLLSGTVDLGLVSPATISPYYAAGKVKVVAQISHKRHPALSNIPTLAELGLKDATVETWYGLMAPAGLPANVREKLEKELTEVLKDPDVLEKLSKLGWFPDPIAGDRFKQFAVDEIKVWKDVAKAAKIEIVD
jgi:tripartite-type tricarboxylate transporter receptor subunit TctC